MENYIKMNMIRKFLKLEAASGILLMLVTVLALLSANSMLSPLYNAFLELPVQLRLGPLDLNKPLILWINDGLMAIFFLLVGLEVKREILQGELSSLPKLALPGIAAVGGMVVPALIYVLINSGDPVALKGWAIPAATDIAFALGILSLLGNRVPSVLKLFLLTLAILDDLGAIVIIALFYSADLSVIALGLAALSLGVLYWLNRRGTIKLSPFLIVGAILWVCVLKSGVHATLAGVALAFAIPLRTGEKPSPLLHLEHSLHPWVAFAIMPIFAFSNAGVSLSGLSFADLLAPVPLGIAAGLFMGKQLGIFLFAFVAVKIRIARLPDGTNWLEFYGMSILCGIGFTMSLFIASLSLDPSGPLAAPGRLGVLSGSFISALSGYFILKFALARRTVPAVDEKVLA